MQTKRRSSRYRDDLETWANTGLKGSHPYKRQLDEQRNPGKVKYFCIKCTTTQVYPGKNANSTEKVCDTCRNINKG